MENEAFERIYTQYYPKVLQYLTNRMHDPSEAENLAQTVFLKLYTKADLFDERKSALSTWIFNITRNTLIDHQRAMAHRNHEELPEILEDERGDLLDDLIMEEQLETLADALERLSEEERNLIVLHYYNGHTLLRVAEQLNRPYGQVKRLHAKALLKLRQYMDPALS